MLEAFPFVPLGGSVRIGVAIFSYDGRINFGVTGDRDSAPDIAVLCQGIEAGVAELLDLSLDAAATDASKRQAGRYTPQDARHHGKPEPRARASRGPGR